MQTTEAFGRSWPRQPQLHSIATAPLASTFIDVLRRSPARVFTTPGVLAELHRHVQSADDDFRDSSWSTAVDVLQRRQVSERGDVPLIDWPDALRKRLGRHGPVDVGLIALSHDLLSDCDEALIVTNEGPLLAEPGRLGLRGVTARGPLELISELLGPDAAAR